MKGKEGQAADQSDAATCTPSDYTIYMPYLPRHENLADITKIITDHFSLVLKNDLDDQNARALALSQRKGCCTKEHEYVEIVEDLSICDVNFAKNNSQMIKYKKQRGVMAKVSELALCLKSAKRLTHSYPFPRLRELTRPKTKSPSSRTLASTPSERRSEWKLA